MRKCDKSPFWSRISFAGFCLHFLHNPINISLPFLCMLHKVCSALWLQNAVTKCQSVKMKAARQCSIITGRAINHRAWVFAPRFLIQRHSSFSVPVLSYIFSSRIPKCFHMHNGCSFSALLEFQLSQCISIFSVLESPPQCLPCTKVVCSIFAFLWF